jgi:hypothetical protein
MRMFFSEHCDAPGIGTQVYRQICVEIGRLLLGFEAEVDLGRDDVLAMQAGHSVQMAWSNYICK